MAEFKFPTEVVDLPSKGHFYVEGHPLAKGKVEVKYMTAKEEDILTSQNLIKQGTVIDVLLQSLIVDKTINIQDLLIGDKNAIMVAARVLGYGKDYQFEYDGEEQTVDLSKLEPVDIDFKKFTKGVNEFSYELPNSERIVTFKLLTARDEKNIEVDLKALKKISKERSSELTTRLKRVLLSVDGNNDKTHVNNFVDNEFLSRDSLAFRQHLSSMTPDIDMSTYINVDGEEIEVTIPVTLRFFWPSSGK
jgi:hypothetical protein